MARIFWDPGLGLALLALATWTSTSSATDQVVVMLSSEAAPYIAAAESLEKNLRIDSLEPIRYLVESAREIPDPDDAAFVAVGTAAARQLYERLPERKAWVFCMVAAPTSLELAARPRVQGISTDIAVGDQITLIAEALPETRSIGMLYLASQPQTRDALRQALPRGWRLEAVEIEPEKPFSTAVESLLERQIDLVWTAPDPGIFRATTVRALLLGALRRQVPVFGFSEPLVRAGALLGVSIDPAEQGRLAAILLQKTRSARDDVSTRQPRSPDFKIVFNPIVAERFDIELPPVLLNRDLLPVH